MDTQKSSPLEHQNVPEAHRGLHDFLYSSEDEHSADGVAVSALAPTADTPLNLEAWCDDGQNAKVAGVYAVLNDNRQTQYIGYSRNVALSVRSHLTQRGTAVCTWVRVQAFKFPKRDDMEKLRDEWIAALPSPPPGNLDNTWADTVKDAASQVMSASEREAYEEKKLKLRRAMADTDLSREPLPEQGTAQTSQFLKAAVEADDWSSVIREQTQDTQPAEAQP